MENGKKREVNDVERPKTEKKKKKKIIWDGKGDSSCESSECPVTQSEYFFFPAPWLSFSVFQST